VGLGRGPHRHTRINVVDPAGQDQDDLADPKVPDNAVITIIGKRRSGKSKLIIDNMYNAFATLASSDVAGTHLLRDSGSSQMQGIRSRTRSRSGGS